MALADLHVHSKYSKHPSQWFLQRIGTQESYTEVEEVYRIAKARGMTFVTLCDHNTIEGAQKLVERFPDDTFMSVEATAYFPEDDCKIHVLVYDLDERQFRDVDRFRKSIYDLRDYLREEQLAHSVAHATYNINGKLRFETLEKLILLFDVFEEINGARNPKYNFTWGQTLSHLTPEDMARLYAKHRIEPFSDEPWVKGLTGGSDDHAGLFIGQTFTEADCDSREEFIRHLKQKHTVGGGKSSNFKSLAFAIYKIACEFSQQGRGKNPDGPLQFVNSLIFDEKKPGLRKRLAIKRMKSKGDETSRIVTKFLEGLMNDFLSRQHLSVDKKIDTLYQKIATMTDDFFAMIFESVERDFNAGDLSGLVKNISAILPALFLSAPFFSTLKHLSHDRELIERLRTEFIDKHQQSEQQVLWFSDTLKDRHEAAISLKQVLRRAGAANRSVLLVTSMPTDLEAKDLPVRMLSLPYIYSYAPEFSSAYTIYVPSLLKSLELIYQQNPDKIILSTPGPLGALGLLAAKLLGIPCEAFYHHDFTLNEGDGEDENLLAGPIDAYLRWLYSYVDLLYTPTRQIAEMLETRGYEAAKLRVFPQAIDSSSFYYDANAGLGLENGKKIPEGFTLLWKGRLNQDSQVKLLTALYQQLQTAHHEINLLILGDEPNRESLQPLLQEDSRIFFLGELQPEKYSEVYSFADLFLSPGADEDHSLRVLKAQACGLPVIVSHGGSARDIVRDGESGFVLPDGDVKLWADAIEEMIYFKEEDAEEYAAMRKQIHEDTVAQSSWEQVLRELFGSKRKAPAPGRSSLPYHPAIDFFEKEPGRKQTERRILAGNQG